ncbi:methyltransferase-like protein [Leptotrombidium deliense]|uniref:Acetylserotonin O-methyltransferase n=1 Tax=Leptotrombidium deliense TaxID=299467 RepID=A0A443SE35_9ACAR|nr:methyltransferase-like protein [Leptotrombidium deliense]
MNKSGSAMLDLLLGATKSHVTYCVAQLDIVDYLSEKPMTAEQLAVITSTNNELLYRLLRAAVSIGLLIENEENQFSVTELGSTLKTGGEQCMKHACKILVNGELTPLPISKLLYRLNKEEACIDNELSYFEKAETDPNFIITLHENINEFDQLFMTHLLISDYDYSKFKHIIDVGGGLGKCLINILKKTPQSRGTIVDLPSVIQFAKQNIERSCVKERCRAVVGDFFSSIPDDSDCYILKFIIQDWCDEQALKILKNVRKSMKNKNCTLLVMEFIKKGTEPNVLDLIDILMFTLMFGKERSKVQFEKLFEKASFEIKNVIDFNPSPMKIIEVEPV